MASVYILFSAKLNTYYIGSCKDLSHRLLEHQQKKFHTSFTSNSDDWELYLSINDLEYSQSRKIENHIKRMKSRVYIENLSKYPEMVEGLRLKY